MSFSIKALKVLEFDKITSRLAEHASTGGAKKRALSLIPSDDYDTVKLRLERTSAARKLVEHKGYPSFYAEEEVAESAERAQKGAILSCTELMRIASLLRSARQLLDYIHTDKPFVTVLDEIFERLVPNREIEERIGRCILSEDFIADEASPALADIRRYIKQLNNKIRDTLASYVGGVQIKYLQENIVTMRDGRYVIPVKAEYRNEVKGLVHDMSASGATLFVEPMAIVEANNKLRVLQSEEAHEIERILAELSALCADASYAIRNDYLLITDLSFAFACASLADEMKCACPNLTEEKKISLVRARHPLIDPKRVVPIHVSLGDSYTTLVITGPNTGGKTVTLKTVGLLTMMTQAGLHIPADDTSVVGICSEVLVDIGDEQSIEQSLSTFSSHMVNIVGVLEQVTDRSLVLFDELGAGTDPIEGAALAISILEKVRASGALTVSTTHYAELKIYALETEGVENACCEFDVSTLKPTYRLIVGMPGKSNAFAISEKLGISPEIIQRAEQLLSGEERRFEQVIESLEASRLEMDKNKAEAIALRRRYEQMEKEAAHTIEKRIKTAEENAKRDSERAKQLLDSTRVTCEYVLKQLEDLRKSQKTDDFHRNLAAAKKELRERLDIADKEYDSAHFSEEAADEEYTLPRPLVVGDKVWIRSINQEGTVQAPTDSKGMVSIQAGILRAKYPISDLRLILAKAEPKATKKVSEGKVKTVASRECKMEIDVRGEYTEDAWYRIDKYLDEALLAGVESVRIIHGKGTGKLRVFIQNMLRTDKRVKAYRNGNYGEGDLGVTVVSFRKS